MNNFYKINTENISYINRELKRKDSQIKQLQKRISNLIDEKSELISEINYLKNRNFDLSSLSEKYFIKNINLYKEKENELLLKIHNLENENDKLKIYISELKKSGNNINNIFESKLSITKKEINNLLIMNAKKDNILSLIQTFLDKIQKALGDIKPSLNIDIRFSDNKSLPNNLKILEANIIKEITSNNNITLKMKRPEKKKIHKNFCIQKKKEYSKNKNKNENNCQKLTIKSKSPFKNRNINNKSFNYKTKILNKNIIKNNYLRTPPKEINNISDYNDYEISNYLSTINNQTAYSRLNNTNVY